MSTTHPVQFYPVQVSHILEIETVLGACELHRFNRNYKEPSFCRAKNHISPEKPYFAIFYHNNFQHVEVNFSHFFYLLGQNVFGFHWQKRNKSVSVKKCRNYRKLKISGEIWSPGEIWFFALCRPQGSKLTLVRWPMVSGFPVGPVKSVLHWPGWPVKGSITIRWTAIPSTVVNFSTFAFSLNFSFMK